MKPMRHDIPLVTGACLGALVAGALIFCLHVSPIVGAAAAPVLLSIVNFVAAGSLVARCVAR
jgi:predicted Kef-type K+ transport protein